MPTKKMTLPKLVEQFGSEDACHEALEEMRWPDGVACIRCGSTAISRIKKRRQYDCDDCRYQFSVRVGTIFHDSKLPLWKWFLAIYIMTESKKGVSANQLKRMLGVSYKTAWYLCHRIRSAIKDENAPKLLGTVEIDETFVGGRRQSETRYDNKSVVMAAVQRDGEVRLKKVPSRRKTEIRRFVKGAVDDAADAVYTDDYRGYKGVTEGKVKHESVRHSPRHNPETNEMEIEWVHGKVHTNTVEGVFSLLKRSIIGSYHKVSDKHLQAYLEEIEWRYNNRGNPYLFRDTILELVKADRLEYKQLTS